MKKVIMFYAALCLLALPLIAAAEHPKDKEKAVYEEFKKLIPRSNIKTVDALYKTWQGVLAGTSNAVIIDIRTEAEFDAGHLNGSNNIDSGHAYTIPEKWPDQTTELWVLCKTQKRSTYFVSLLYKYGYKNVYLVEEGIEGWARKGYPLVNEYFGEFKVIKYERNLRERYRYRENK